MISGYPRDLVGYGSRPPQARWPGGARVAVSVVVNVEEGSERAVIHGDEESENGVNDVIGAEPFAGRDLRVESMFEYGARAGAWRLLRILDEAAVPATVFAVGMAVERHPDLVASFAEAGHEICGHGYRWADYRHIGEATERDHIRRTVAAIETATGARPVGWYTGRTSLNTRRLVVEEGGFLYDSDAYNDDLPYWVQVSGRPHLVLPYSFDTNDMRYVSPAGFGSVEDFVAQVIATFEELYAEGAQAPRMMSIGLHTRLAGRPGRAHALRRVLDHLASHDGVWFARRIDIARHWAEVHPIR
ncbi:allantoinase PuuE [Nocardioides acrostichi]|uniref:Allantoinase PuuE n=1 Tax=Nocardioides acrostichi TaxID=2784339 RepID=A0A930Y655_9ACTN|nr:allantoinase PuuE [Nocardioides acrostichi]MBF4161975.1 allantoinase PuuE [Nocardioides acrostichi]